jgi:hypothetical protein
MHVRALAFLLGVSPKARVLLCPLTEERKPAQEAVDAT